MILELENNEEIFVWVKGTNALFILAYVDGTIHIVKGFGINAGDDDSSDEEILYEEHYEKFGEEDKIDDEEVDIDDWEDELIDEKENKIKAINSMTKSELIHVISTNNLNVKYSKKNLKQLRYEILVELELIDEEVDE